MHRNCIEIDLLKISLSNNKNNEERFANHTEKMGVQDNFWGYTFVYMYEEDLR